MLTSPSRIFLSPPTFWEARDQPEPGSFFPRMKDPGNEVEVVDLLGSQISAPRCEEEPEIRLPYNLSDLAGKSLSQDSSGGK